tara:strand:+ start:522 stop:1841 length:1320 start_codon:yes stop_codon:yes gene_type:complete
MGDEAESATDGGSAAVSVGVSELRVLSSEGYALQRDVGCGVGCTGVLQLRRLILSNDDLRRARGIKKKRPTVAESRSLRCSGAIFGSCLKSCLAFSGLVGATTKKQMVEAMRHIVRFLSPAVESMASCTGEDCRHLINGLASTRVSNRQRHLLVECHEAPGVRTYAGRVGLNYIAMGATASVLCAHYLMFVGGAASAADVSENLRRCAKRTDELLQNWPISLTSDGLAMQMQFAALGAERRAIARARASAVAAASLARAQHLSPEESLRLTLSWMVKAAWPAGAVCGSASHEAVCSSLRVQGCADLAFATQNPGDPGLRRSSTRPAFGRGLNAFCVGDTAVNHPPVALPLGALPSVAWLSGRAGSDGSGSRSGCSSGSSYGSNSSFFSAGAGSSCVDDVACLQDLGELAYGQVDGWAGLSLGAAQHGRDGRGSNQPWPS